VEHQAFCELCGQRIGIGYVSPDVHNMATVMHRNCYLNIPIEVRNQARIKSELKQKP
jgi:hypothetical protein